MNSAFEIAQANIGLNEGQKHAALQDFLATGGQNLDPATTAWCAAFVNATLQQSGQQGTNALNARSFMEWGQGVDDPQRGDIAVFSRGDPNGWQGHVGFFEGYNPDGSIRVLGGNQGDAVSVSSYGADRLLGFRRGGASQPQQQQPQQNALGAVAQQAQRNALPVPQLQIANNALDPAAFMSRRRFGNALGNV